MQNQFFPQAFQQTFNSQVVRPEGCYQNSPFGVVLHPVSERTNQTAFPQSNLSPPNSPMSPPLAMQPSKLGENPSSLSSLSCGGYIYPNYLRSPQSPPQPPMFLPPQTPSSPQFTANCPQFVSTEIAARQEKLEKYREKRCRRNYNRPVDQQKRDRACARTRDPQGHFASEFKREQEKMRAALEASQMESIMLKNQLSNIENELALLRQKAEEESASKQSMQKELEEQQQMNQVLLRENSLLWSSVPSDEVFSTINQSNPPVYLDAFKQKIDFSTIELTWTDSPLLEAARVEDTDVEARWLDDMDFFAGARS